MTSPVTSLGLSAVGAADPELFSTGRPKGLLIELYSGFLTRVGVSVSFLDGLTSVGCGKP